MHTDDWSDAHEVTFRYGPTRGGRSFPTKQEALDAAARMRESGVTVTSIHPTPRYPWPDAPVTE